MKQQRFKCQTINYDSQIKGPFRISYNNSEKVSSYFLNYRWTTKENAKYVAFLLKYQEILNGKTEKKLWPVYIEMASFIKTRNFRQCKLYHQKLITQCKQISNIVKKFQRQNPLFQLFLEEQKQLLWTFTNSNQTLQLNQIIHGQQKQKNEKTSEKYTHEPLQMSKQGQDSVNLRNKWLSCHQLFLAWTSKLTQLMMDGHDK